MPKKSHSFQHISLVMEGPMCRRDEVRGPKDMVAFFRKRIGSNAQESFIGLYLDARNAPLGWREVSRGTLNASLVHPRECFLPAVKLAAATMIICHNHPSGNPTPSPDDIHMTKRLAQAGQILGIDLMDHVIITRDDYVSMRDQGYYVLSPAKKQDWEP